MMYFGTYFTAIILLRVIISNHPDLPSLFSADKSTTKLEVYDEQNLSRFSVGAPHHGIEVGQAVLN